MTTQTRISLQDFLALPEEKPYMEFVNGEVYEKPLPNDDHGTLTAEIIWRVASYMKESGEGRVRTEVRHLYESEEEERVFLPDIHVTLKERRPPRNRLSDPVTVQPDFAIEVLSPGDRPSRIADRVNFFLRAGVRLVWLVDPEGETITAFRPGEATQVLRRGDTADARPVLRDFQLDVSALFDTLNEE